jgi:hypothetical protein
VSELLLPRLVRFLASCQLSDLNLEHERVSELFERASLAYETERAELQHLLDRALEEIRGAPQIVPTRELERAT